MRISGITNPPLKITIPAMHTEKDLWFIARLFPKAKIIHCKRHPLDTCLSCYFTHFKQQLPYKNDLYTSSVGRWKKYERFLAPLIEGFGGQTA